MQDNTKNASNTSNQGFMGFLTKHWKVVTVISVIVFLFILGYILIAIIGAPAGVSTKYSAEVSGAAYGSGNAFSDPLGALAWYFNVVLIDNFLGVPAILLSVLSFVGYLILKRGFVDSLVGAIKTGVGVLLLSVGSTALSGIVAPIFTGIRTTLGIDVVSLDPYTGWSAGLSFLGAFGSSSYAAWISYALLIGFVINIILVALRKWTNCHAVMTTGHIMFQQSAVVVPIVYVLFFVAQNNAFIVTGGIEAGTVIFAGVFLGVYWSVNTTANIKATNVVTENANFAIGHQQGLGISLAYYLGKFFKFTKGEVVSAENRKLSKKWKIFEDNVFVQCILILILFLVLAIIIEVAAPNGSKFSQSIVGTTWWPTSTIGTFWLVQVVFGAMFTVAAILAIITGVRMFVTELQQSFQGISEKLIPGSVVAVDIAAVYGFSPNAVTYGFLAGVIGQYLAAGIMIGLSIAIPNFSVAVVPLFITLFFNSGAVGVYANIKGGWKASVILPMIYGFIEIIVISIALGQYFNIVDSASATAAGDISAYTSGYNGMIDWNFFFGLPLIFASLHPVIAYIILPAEIIALLIFVQFVDTGMSHKNVSPIRSLWNKRNNKYAVNT